MDELGLTADDLEGVVRSVIARGRPLAETGGSRV
jgi:hypothetical protein